jgi:hypothetical protein
LLGKIIKIKLKINYPFKNLTIPSWLFPSSFILSSVSP